MFMPVAVAVDGVPLDFSHRAVLAVAVTVVTYQMSRQTLTVV